MPRYQNFVMAFALFAVFQGVLGAQAAGAPNASPRLSLRTVRSAPDVAARVQTDAQENIQIHDIFQSEEDKDIQRIRQIKLGSSIDLSALQLNHTEVRSAGPIQDPCDGIECAANLKCPGGFKPTKVAGHCCHYCVNPNIKVEEEVTGPTGTSGGKKSEVCEEVWCFPTLCKKDVVQPTKDNGNCCPTCPSA